ncbi:MAG TPA: hypothetical protein VHV77_09855 [Pirellulales bacterium]|jgi:hypothetical protein|nr:hypothetical protein [Pirellulales bacterium]
MHRLRPRSVSRFALLATVLSYCLAQTAGAQDLPSSVSDALSASTEINQTDPKKVHVGVYVNQIDSVSLKDSQVTVDFHIWFRWTDPDIKPLETFDIVNGKIDTKEDVVEQTMGDVHYACCRVMATIHKLWDVSDFPLDEHMVDIQIEDGEFEDFKQQYIADDENCGLNPEAEIAGWALTPEDATVVSHAYNTNYGDVSLPTGHASNYSRFIYSIKIARPGYGMFIKLFAGLFIAAAISFHALLIQPSELDARFGLAVGAMFAAVASEYIVVSSLPESNYLTLADKLHITTFAFVFISLAVSVLSAKVSNHGHERLCWWIDRAAFVGLTSIYAIFVISEIMLRW